MHRTQLLLEDWQYEALLARSEGAGVSLAELVRRAITAWLQADAPPEAQGAPLLAMEGILEDESDSAQEHDAALYGREPR